MNAHDSRRIRDLLQRLDALEARQPGPEERAILEIARDAILEEISRLYRRSGLRLYRTGRTVTGVPIAS